MTMCILIVLQGGSSVNIVTGVTLSRSEEYYGVLHKNMKGGREGGRKERQGKGMGGDGREQKVMGSVL